MLQNIFSIYWFFNVLHWEVCFFINRASLSEFVVPLAKYQKAMYMQVSLGMRFRMMFETEESGIRRYMGTITGISDLDPIHWKNSQWRNLQVRLKLSSCHGFYFKISSSNWRTLQPLNSWHEKWKILLPIFK